MRSEPLKNRSLGLDTALRAYSTSARFLSTGIALMHEVRQPDWAGLPHLLPSGKGYWQTPAFTHPCSRAAWVPATSPLTTKRVMAST
jgi:hypothetical protein